LRQPFANWREVICPRHSLKKSAVPVAAIVFLSLS
jgi:hypothetical protein